MCVLSGLTCTAIGHFFVCWYSTWTPGFPCWPGGPISPAGPWQQETHKAFWVTLSASLLLVIIALGLTGHLWQSQPHSQVHTTVPHALEPPYCSRRCIPDLACIDQSLHLLVLTDCPNHSSGSDWTSDQPVSRCGPAEWPGDLFCDFTGKSDVHCALWYQACMSRGYAWDFMLNCLLAS